MTVLIETSQTREIERREEPSTGRRRLLQFLPFNFAKPGSQRLPCGRNINPSLAADLLCTSSLVRVNEVTIVLVADVSPEVIQNRFHGHNPIGKSPGVPSEGGLGSPPNAGIHSR